MSSIELRDLSKSFGDGELFSHLNLTIDSGRLTVILGPSGCGKSTLLRLIAGLEDPDAGAILIDGEDVTSIEPRNRGVAMVFQNYALYPHLTVRENLGFPLRVARMPKQEAAPRVEKAADLLGLAGLLDRYPKTLSGGERQRTAVGRAIVRDPRLFLFDEPLSNLDFQLRNRMRGELVSLQRKLGKTMVYVTHDQTEGMTMADTLVLMNKGRVVQIGPPAEVYEKPANLFAAGFIGSPPMNVLRCQSSGGALLIDGGTIRLCDAPIADGIYLVGIRPNDLQVANDDSGASMKVQHSEFHGSESYLFGTIAGQALIACGRRSDSYPAGTEAAVRFDPARLHLFDPNSGKRVEPLSA